MIHQVSSCQTCPLFSNSIEGDICKHKEGFNFNRKEMKNDFILIIRVVMAIWVLFLVYIIILELSFSNPILNTSIIPLCFNLITYNWYKEHETNRTRI